MEQSLLIIFKVSYNHNNTTSSSYKTHKSTREKENNCKEGFFFSPNI